MKDSMRATVFLRWIALVSVVSLSLACRDLFGPDERVITMDVASQTVTCTGLVEQQCLRVREHPDTAWHFFYDGIEGFQFEQGFEYTLRVAVRNVRNPPADGSSLAYRLVAILKKVPA